MKLTRQNIRTLAMPLAMVVGVALCRPLAIVEEVTQHTLTPVLIAAMLFITFCRVDIRQMRLEWSHLWMLLIQFVGAAVVYYAVTPLLGQEVGQGAMICVMAPIAMAAVVIGGMLGGNVTMMVTYSLIHAPRLWQRRLHLRTDYISRGTNAYRPLCRGTAMPLATTQGCGMVCGTLFHILLPMAHIANPRHGTHHALYT